MKPFVVATTVLVSLLASCSNSIPEIAPLTNEEISQQPASQAWWRQLNDSYLNQDITTALSNNPSLQTVALRIQQADAATEAANAAKLPHLNLGFGYENGRARDVDFGPYDLSPWKSSAGLKWEIDLFGKLKTIKNAAIEKRNATVWDAYSARLSLAANIAKVRMNLYRLNSELSYLNSTIAGQNNIITDYKDQLKAGLIAEAPLLQQRAQAENLNRSKQELQRLRDLSVVQLRVLRGGTPPNNTSSSKFPSPKSLSSTSIKKLLSSHPTILAAEARVRSELQLEHAAKLDFLPSLQFNLLASGRQKSLVERFRIWSLSAGPALNIPIYDPSRMATLRSNKSKAKIAASQYKESVLQVLGEIDSAKINLLSKQSQLTSAKKETTLYSQSLKNAQEQLDAGLTSRSNFLNTEASWLNSKRNEAALRQAVLAARIDLFKSTGG